MSWKESTLHFPLDTIADRDIFLLKNAISQSPHHHILLSLTPEDYYFGPQSRYKPETEPPPHVNYWSIYMMIRLLRPHLDKKYLKRWEYLVQTRKAYFDVHEKFFDAFNGLQDTRAFEEIMNKKCEGLAEQVSAMEEKGAASAILNKKKRNLEDFKFQIAMNRLESVPLVERVQDLARRKDQASAWLSQSKSDLVKNDLGTLVYMTRQLLGRYKMQSLEQATGHGGKSTGDQDDNASVSPITLRPSSSDEMEMEG